MLRSTPPVPPPAPGAAGPPSPRPDELAEAPCVLRTGRGRAGRDGPSHACAAGELGTLCGVRKLDARRVRAPKPDARRRRLWAHLRTASSAFRSLASALSEASVDRFCWIAHAEASVAACASVSAGGGVAARRLATVASTNHAPGGKDSLVSRMPA
jgi:hypothetical protein